jgi:DNA replicative helicase MCM subunit Mcm2 (Cdc46/Mcm family)
VRDAYRLWHSQLLLSLIWLVLSFAQFLSPQVTEDDVRDAYRLWHDALSVAAADEEGRLDMNLLTGGTSGAQRQFMEHVLPDLLRSLLNGERSC